MIHDLECTEESGEGNIEHDTGQSYQRRPSSRVAAEGLDQYKEHS